MVQDDDWREAICNIYRTIGPSMTRKRDGFTFFKINRGRSHVRPFIYIRHKEIDRFVALIYVWFIVILKVLC